MSRKLTDPFIGTSFVITKKVCGFESALTPESQAPLSTSQEVPRLIIHGVGSQ